MKTIHHVPAIERLTIVDIFLCWGADPRTTDLSFCAVIWIKEIILTILLLVLNMRVFRCKQPSSWPTTSVEWIRQINLRFNWFTTGICMTSYDEVLGNVADLEKRHHIHTMLSFNAFRMIFTSWANMNDITSVCVCVCHLKIIVETNWYSIGYNKACECSTLHNLNDRGNILLYFLKAYLHLHKHTHINVYTC